VWGARSIYSKFFFFFSTLKPSGTYTMALNANNLRNAIQMNFAAGRYKGDEVNIKALGTLFIGRYPGLAERIMARMGYQSVQEIEWNKAEAEAMAGSGMAGRDTMPIQEIYDLINTIEQTLAALRSFGQDCKQYHRLSSKERAKLRDNIIRADFRPQVCHRLYELGALDSTNLDMTAGQILGDLRLYKPGTRNRPSRMGGKSWDDLYTDVAALYTYTLLHDIQAINQGLWKVRFTRAKKLGINGAQLSQDDIPPGSWINAAECDASTEFNIQPLFASMHPGDVYTGLIRGQPYNRFHALASPNVLYNQDPQTSKWAYAPGANRMPPAAAGRLGVFQDWRDGYGCRSVDQTPSVELGGAINSVLLRQDRENDDNNIEAKTRFFTGQHPISHVTDFRVAILESGVGGALWQMYGWVQQLYEMALGNNNAAYNNPLGAWRRKLQSCPAGSGLVSIDSRRKIVPSYIQTEAGTVRNPAAVGTQCMEVYNPNDPPSFDMFPSSGNAAAAARIGTAPTHSRLRDFTIAPDYAEVAAARRGGKVHKKRRRRRQ
jgi:hypothetical protein